MAKFIDLTGYNRIAEKTTGVVGVNVDTVVTITQHASYVELLLVSGDKIHVVESHTEILRLLGERQGGVGC